MPNPTQQIHVDESEYLEAREEYYGYCLECGEQRGECEPDARGYYCDNCGCNAVYGAEELLIMGRLFIR